MSLRIIGGLGLLLALSTSCSQAGAARRGQPERGASIFSGAVELDAHLAGQTEKLPAMATRCVNCHEKKTKQPDGKSATYAPELNRAWLTAVRPRHGGPPSAYTAATLCTLLKTGVDPAQVLIPTSMPRYNVSDAQCADLWAFVEGR